MPEPFKNFFNPELIKAMAGHLARQSTRFDAPRFREHALNGLDALELKQRSNQITDALCISLPDDFRSACSILVNALHPEDDVDLSELTTDARGLRGWAIMPMADFVARKGLDDFDHGMDVLKEMTKRMSAEFAVRPFIAADAERAMRHVKRWARDPNYHVRRLASEGSRPRLPWGLRLNEFVADPEPILPVLETLRDDPEEYVRRSVANSLNDIAKDHPDLVAEIAGDWLSGDPGKERQRLVRHACRSLIKAGHRPTLKALGYGQASVALENLSINNETIRVGEALRIRAELRSTATSDQDLIVDYVVHHRKANGGTSPKVFKWKAVRLAAGESLVLEKSHSMRPVTTRTYYGGQHVIEIQANGKRLGEQAFTLVL
ncbi:DNA alkylation repair protein [Hoeflea poritis]|uniref:DNA alkylation repair protein n=1 Tax=Hoeflea poritis TaxID=2993659 RepID=A0ABT4VJK1_9HYPH|nr:DNA alkylation repair protein [Hoeflea poritis]MDA4844297.1 DNA alkylation repair protein [Hoeflea poritis]